MQACDFSGRRTVQVMQKKTGTQASQGRMRQVGRCAASFLLSAVLAVSGPAAFAPKARAAAETGEQTALRLAKRYDPDGYYLLKTMAKRGDDIASWWSNETFFASGYDTAVHEECHAYTELSGRRNKRIYTGGKKYLKVPEGLVFNTHKIAKGVPKKLRTARYDAYVASNDPRLSSNVEGIYGLLDEFVAYCWGFSGSIKMYSFVSEQQPTPDAWLDYVASTASIANARAEFRYFIERYIAYAKTNKPKVYKSIMGNKALKKALKKIDAKFASRIASYDKKLPKICKAMRKAGYVSYGYDGSLYIGTDQAAWGVGLQIGDYNLFASELSKKKYRSIEKKLGLSKVAKRKISLPARNPAYSGQVFDFWELSYTQTWQ